MGRRKHCTEEKHERIQNLRKHGKTYKEIQDILGFYAQIIVNGLTYKKKPETLGRKRKTSAVGDRCIMRYCKTNPFALTKTIQNSQ